MSNVIFQFFIGNPTGYINCIKSVNKYCQKHNIKHFLSQKRMFPQQHITLEKYQLLQFAEDPSIDRVLYVDADIMITPNAKNIFEEYPDNSYVYAYDENDNTNWMNRDQYIFEKKNNLDWPINSRGKKQYFNSGVMLFPNSFLKNNKQVFNFSDIPQWENIWYFGDQTPLNYWFVKHNVPFKSFDYSFNRMDLGNFDPTNNRYKANFIHYAGPCKYGNGNKIETMINDYKELYNKDE